MRRSKRTQSKRYSRVLWVIIRHPLDRQTNGYILTVRWIDGQTAENTKNKIERNKPLNQSWARSYNEMESQQVETEVDASTRRRTVFHSERGTIIL